MDKLWWCLTEEHQRWLSKWRRLLRRAGGAVAGLSIRAPDARGGWQAAHELLPLLGPQLEALWLHFAKRDSLTPSAWHPGAAAAMVLPISLPQLFPQLRVLHLRAVPPLAQETEAEPQVAYLQSSHQQELASFPPLPASLPAQLAQLPLTELVLNTAHTMPDGLLASLPASLTWLELASTAAPLPPLQHLTTLSQLQGLGLVDGRHAHGGTLQAVPPPRGFPNLQTFKLVGVHAALQVRARGACCRVLPSLAVHTAEHV